MTSSPSTSSSSSQPSTTSQSSTNSPSTTHSSSTVHSSSTTQARASESFKGDPAQALHEYLESLSTERVNKAPNGSSASPNPAPLEEIIQPELLYKASSIQSTEPQKAAPENLPGLEKQPLLVRFPIEENLNLYSFYERTLEPKLKTIFESVSEAGDYGDGPLYKLTRGTYTAYLSLMPPKKAVGAIISVWSKDPRAN